jgi:hypothetical protein
MKKFINKTLQYLIKKFKRFRYSKLNDINNLEKFLVNKPNSIIFDVGANIGQSVKLFKKNLKNPIIYCFEPISECLDIIKKNYTNDKQVILINAVVGKEKQQLNFYINYKNSTSSFKKLIPNNYKLFSIQRGGSLISDYIFQTDLVYVSKDIYESAYLKSIYFNN